MEIRLYKVPAASLSEAKKVLEAQDKIEKQPDGSSKTTINEFARNGYQLRDGNVIGLQAGFSYLYVQSDAASFAKHQKEILAIKDVQRLSGDEMEKAKTKIEEEQYSVASGIGLLGEF